MPRIAFAEVAAHADQCQKRKPAAFARQGEVQTELTGSIAEVHGVDGKEVDGLVVAVIVLLIAFGSVMAAGIPIATALIGLAIGLTGIGVMAGFTDVPTTSTLLASMIGLGLALARRDRRVLVVTGDGELLMNVGALATIAVKNPANLAIVCVDNGHYGETGYQKSHTSLGVDLEKIAAGSGIKVTRAIASQEEVADGARLLREGNGTAFVLLKVKPDDPPSFKRNMDPASCRVRFRGALLGSA